MNDYTQAAARMRQEFDDSFAAALDREAVVLENLLAIRVANDPYAIRLSEISGILANRPIVPLPSPVTALLGLVGDRSALIPVYDLRALMGYGASKEPRWIVVANVSGLVAGFALEGFEGQLRVPSAALAAAHLADAAARHIAQLVRVDDMVRPVLSIPSLLEAISRLSGSLSRKER